MAIKIKNEFEFKKWFERNFKRLGYSSIIKKDNGIYPDFILIRNNKPVRIELETLSSNFIFHNHNPEKVDEVVCIKKDAELKVPIIEAKGLIFSGGKKRISATVDKETINLINLILIKGDYRNKSHIIEKAIERMAKEEK